MCTYLAERPRGLVLVTGPTGSGKSTTLAAMVDHINETRPLHIMTMEDPIEFMHRNKKSYVNQREVGEDTHSFASALKRVLRQDPDVILVGEMRDLETIAAAITAAETGHLVLATLHTTGGPETVDRVIDVFPPHQQQQVRMQLSNSLEGVLSQTLLRSTDGAGRVMAMEIMLGVPAIQNLIREGKTHQMETIIQGGASLGMQTLDQHLKNLLTAGQGHLRGSDQQGQEPARSRGDGGAQALGTHRTGATRQRAAMRPADSYPRGSRAHEHRPRIGPLDRQAPDGRLGRAPGTASSWTRPRSTRARARARGRSRSFLAGARGLHRAWTSSRSSRRSVSTFTGLEVHRHRRSSARTSSPRSTRGSSSSTS